MVRLLSLGALLVILTVGCGGELVGTTEMKKEKLSAVEKENATDDKQESPKQKKQSKEQLDRNDPEERLPVDAMRHRGKVLVAQTSEDGKHVLFTWNDRKLKGSLDIPKDAGEIMELRIGRFLGNGYFSLAVETKSADSEERFYFWSHGYIWLEKETVDTNAPSRFLKSKTNYEISGVHNSFSDSLYIVLVKHRRFTGAEQRVDGYVFIHNCAWGNGGGTLYPLSQKEGKAVGYPGEKEELEQKK